MSDAEHAYEAAQQEIARVKAAGETELDLSGAAYRALDRLPPELAELTALQTLALNRTKVSDLAPLQGLTALETLWLSRTQVSDLAPVQGLTALQTLDLHNTLVSDLAPLQGLTALQRLDLDHTQVSDLAPVQGLTALRTLPLSGTQVSDLAPLQGLTALQTLLLNGTEVSDIAPLQGLNALQTLWLDSTQVTDLAPLQGLTALQTLLLSSTQVSDIAPLQGLTALQTLWLSGTQVSDIAPFQGLNALQTLWLSGTQVSDIAPLQGLTALQTLFLQVTQVSDLAPLQGLNALQRLGLDGTQVSDLRPIAGLEQLASDEEEAGLSFENTSATKRDARLQKFAQINDRQDRTRQTLDYLRSLPPWPEPYTPTATPDGSPPQPIGGVPTPPDQDPALPLIWGEKGFTFFAESIPSDPVTEAALEDLRDLLGVLRRKGNAHDDLYRIAGELLDRSAGAVPDLNMIRLHLSYQKLRRLHKGRAARENPFDDETVSNMEAVFDILPGVTLADENVNTLIKRQEAERAAGQTASEDAAARALLADVQDLDAPFAPDVKDAAAELIKEGVDDRLSGTRQILARNVVIATLKWVANTSGAGIVGSFAYNNGSDILAYAATMGDDALFWANSVFAKFRVEYELAMGLAREVVASPKPRRDPFNRKDR